MVVRFVPYSAMAVYPFILIKRKEMEEDKVLLNHEKIHHRQQLELLLVFFYLFYLVNYLYNLAKYRHHHTAYKEIVFEREAFAKDCDLNYLAKRKPFSFLQYFKTK